MQKKLCFTGKIEYLCCFLFLLFLNPASSMADDDSVKTAEIREILENNPDIVYNALVKYQEKQAAKAKASVNTYMLDNKENLFYHKNDGLLGNPQGKTTLLLINDYLCSHCKRSRSAIDGIIQSDKDVRVVIKQLPILGKESLYAAKAATLAKILGKFSAFDKNLRQTQPPVTIEKINKALVNSGINPNDIKKKESILNEHIQKNYTHAQKLMIRGTPSLIVFTSSNGQAVFVENPMDKNAIEEVIAGQKMKIGEDK